MSQDQDETLTEGPAPGDAGAEQAPAPQDAPEEPSPVEAPPPLEALQERPARAPSPVVGPALWVSGVLLWAYVVMGQFTTSWFSHAAPLGEAAATLGVVLATAIALRVAVGRSLHAREGKIPGRAARVGLLALLLAFLVVTVLSVIARATTADLDGLVMAVLTTIALAAFLNGRRLTGPAPVPPTHRQRVFGALLWVGVGAVTLGACAEAAAAG